MKSDKTFLQGGKSKVTYITRDKGLLTKKVIYKLKVFFIGASCSKEIKYI